VESGSSAVFRFALRLMKRTRRQRTEPRAASKEKGSDVRIGGTDKAKGANLPSLRSAITVEAGRG